MNTKFSIVITTYNRLSLLTRAIDTALNQTLNCEVIVVDDCSCDGTQEYVQSLCQKLTKSAKKSLIYHRNKVNIGHSESVNTGVALATGEWIKLVDDDDYLALNCLEEVSQVIRLNPQAAICSFQAAQVDEHQQQLSITRRVGSNETVFIPQEDIHYGMLMELLPFGTPIQVAFRRDAFLQSGGWDSSLDTNFDDIDSWVKISQFGSAIFLNKCLAYRTVWSGAYNRKFSLQKRLETHLLIKSRIYDCVHAKYQNIIPTFLIIENYLKLHWGLRGLKYGKFNFALKQISPILFALNSWQFFWGKEKRIKAFFASLPFLPWQRYLDKHNNEQICSAINWKLIQNYVQLRWGWKALCQGKLLLALNLALQAVLNCQSRKLLLIILVPHLYQAKVQFNQQTTKNIPVIEKLYKFIIDKHQKSLPKDNQFNYYLKVSKFLLACRDWNMISAIRFGIPTIMSPVTWRFLVRVANG